MGDAYTKLKELEIKKKKKETKKHDSKKLEESILKELKITKENLESYIEELLEKIIVIEKSAEEPKKISKCKNENQANVELKIILAGDNVIKHCIPEKSAKISQEAKINKTDYNFNQCCYTHAHS